MGTPRIGNCVTESINKRDPENIASFLHEELLIAFQVSIESKASSGLDFQENTKVYKIEIELLLPKPKVWIFYAQGISVEFKKFNTANSSQIMFFRLFSW